MDLPPNIGVCFLDLGHGTKTSRGFHAKVIVAYESLSGLSLGRWIKLASRYCGVTDMASDDRPVFTHPSGKPWTSKYFRRTFLYPALERQRQEGDAFLRAFDGTPGNTIPRKFWSLHCYQRGARTHSTKGGKSGTRQATKDQVYEHGRWCRRRSAEAIDKQYDEWTLEDRIRITLFCH